MPSVNLYARRAVLAVVLCASGSRAATDEQLLQLVGAHSQCAAYARFFDDGATTKHYTAGYAAWKRLGEDSEQRLAGASRAEGTAFDYGVYAGRVAGRVTREVDEAAKTKTTPAW